MSARDRRRSRTRLRAMTLVVLGATAALHLVVGASPGFSSPELAEVRAATARFHRIPVAKDAGWDLVPGLDHCFEHPDRGAMGYHYINVELLTTAGVDAAAPEALVYAPGPNGQRRLAAVEWIVPYTLSPRNGPAPTVMGHPLHHNDPLGVWVLHAWIFEHNPSGMFEDWNPRVTCP